MMFSSLRRGELARHLPPADERPVAGVESEYRLTTDTGRPVDARVHLSPLLADLPHLDPGDRRAVRLAIGSALTCDGWEAEAVTPPLPWGPSTARDLTDCVAATRSELLAILSAEPFAVQGFSTHLNVSVPDRKVVTVARDLAQRCSVALTLLTEGPAGDGLLIRPRRGRLEVGCDHLEDAMVAPAVVLLIGLVGLLQHRRSRLPRLEVGGLPSREKYGSYVARDAAGADLVVSGRATPLRTRRGARLSAQEHLERVWRRPGRTPRRTPGRSPRPMSSSQDDPPALKIEAGAPTTWTTAGATPSGSAQRWGVDLDPRVRTAGSATAAWATWDTTAWRCVPARGGERYAVVPRTQHAGFLAELDAGRLDDLLFPRG